MQISISREDVKKATKETNGSNGLANYIYGIAKTIDKYLSKTWLGKSQLDRLLEDQLKQGTEQIYLAYRKPLFCFLQSKIDHPFTTVGIYKESTHESEICRELDNFLNGGSFNYRAIRKHLDTRRNMLLECGKGTFATELFEIFSMCKLIELQATPSKFEAAKLKAIMDKNIFSEGVILNHGYLPKMVKRNKLFRLHFHVGDEYIPASQFDIDFAQSLPFVVCSYSKNQNRTKVSLLYKIAGGENMFFGQKNEKTVLPARDINLILGYHDHNDMMPALAQPYLCKPEMSVKPLSDTEYAIKCKTQAAPMMLEVWGIEGQNGIYHGSMKGTEDGDFDPPEHWRDYVRLDPETFQVKFRTPKAAKHPIFYFINYDYLGASWYGDEQVYASAA